MKNLSIKTRSTKNANPQYKDDLIWVTTFLRHSEDRIEVESGEQTHIHVYDNGTKIFSGTKTEFFNKLKSISK